MPAAERARAPSAAAQKLALSTAHFGREGPKGQGRAGMSMAEATAAVTLAAEAGVRIIDSSARWSGSETLLSQILPAHPQFDLITKTVSPEGGPAAVETAARASLRRLGVHRGRALIVQSAGDLLRDDGPEIWAVLQRLQDEGLFDQIGIAATAADDPVGLQRRFKPDVMQLPANLLDQRLIQDGTFERLAERGVDVHVRSVFQAGLLFRSRADLAGDTAAIGPRLSRIQRAIAEAGADLLHAGLSFALSRPEAALTVVKVASPQELRAVLAAAAAPPPRLDYDALAFQDAARFDRAVAA